MYVRWLSWAHDSGTPRVVSSLPSLVLGSPVILWDEAAQMYSARITVGEDKSRPHALRPETAVMTGRALSTNYLNT